MSHDEATHVYRDVDPGKIPMPGAIIRLVPQVFLSLFLILTDSQRGRRVLEGCGDNLEAAYEVLCDPP